MAQSNGMRMAFIRATLVVGAVLYIFSGVTLLLTPGWFLANVGPFAPFNRHYMGDAGSFVLALGVGLLLAIRDPLRQRLLIATVLLGTLVHTLNHAYGDLVLAELPATEVGRDLVPLLIFAVLLAVSYWLLLRKADPN